MHACMHANDQNTLIVQSIPNPTDYDNILKNLKFKKEVEIDHIYEKRAHKFAKSRDKLVNHSCQFMVS